MEVYLISFALGVLVTYLLLTYAEGREKLVLTKQHDNLKVRFDAFDKAHMELVMREASTRKTVNELNFKVECMSGKIEANDDLTERELDGLKEMCINMRNQILDVKELAVSKRPVNKVIFDATAIELVKPGFDPATMKQVKKQMKEMSK